MKRETGFNLRVAGLIIGGVLVNIPLGVIYYYGNLSTYIDSYYIGTIGRGNHTTGSVWITSLWQIFHIVGLIISQLISHRIGARLTLLAGMIVFNMAVYFSYFALRSSFWSLHITLGVLTGVSSGLCFAKTLVIIVAWIKRRVGLASAVVSSALGGGSFIFNLAATFTINPHNWEPDIKVFESRYFSQEEIISRVPYVFFVLGGLTTVCHVIAFPLMRNPPDLARTPNTELSPINSSPKEQSCENGAGNKAPDTDQLPANSNVDLTTDKNDKSRADNPERRDLNIESVIVAAEQSTSVGFTPLMALKSKTFYLLGISLALVFVGFVVENSCYKQFGILFISDDYFLANIGVGINVASCLGRIAWGVALDKLNIKSVLVLVSSSHSLVLIFWYFTPGVNKWFYFIWTVTLQASLSGTFVVYPIAVLKLFGSDYYMTIYGMVSSFGIVVNFAIPALVKVVLPELGLPSLLRRFAISTPDWRLLGYIGALLYLCISCSFWLLHITCAVFMGTGAILGYSMTFVFVDAWLKYESHKGETRTLDQLLPLQNHQRVLLSHL